MALRIDRPRFRGILRQMDLPPAISEELLDAVEEEVDRSRSDLATKTDLAQQMLEMENRIMRMLLVHVGLTIGAIGVAVGILIAVLG